MPDYREFLRTLSCEARRASLFEPFPDKQLVSSLIWRSGDHLWASTARTVSTLIDYYAYIKSDVAVIDARGHDIIEITTCAGSLPIGMKFVIIADDLDTLHIADADDSVCALATTTVDVQNLSKPVIFIDTADTGLYAFETAHRSGFAGFYAASRAEELIEAARGKIALLGGLGAGYVNSAEPVEIHGRVRALHEASRGGWAVGSGSTGGKLEYLGFISMLGIYNKLI